MTAPDCQRVPRRCRTVDYCVQVEAETCHRSRVPDRETPWCRRMQVRAPWPPGKTSDRGALIGLDEVGESAIYVVGVGTRPKGRVANPGKIPKRGPYAAE
jgi:hypothetical protein